MQGQSLRLKDLQRDVLLAPYTTYQIGGPADYFVVAHDKDELLRSLSLASTQELPCFLLGQGANILLGDKGFRGLVIQNQVTNTRMDGSHLTAASGCSIAELIELTRNLGLSGLEHFVGIPSSVGGAIRQNLHFLSPDRESTVFIGDLVEQATVLDETGHEQVVDRDWFEFGYDQSVLHHRAITVLEVTFQLTPESTSQIQKRIDANLAWRHAKQPQLAEFPSCGSVFKKISGAGAGRLIEQAGLKGRRIGQVEVSSLHANYLVNLGGATAGEVRRLIRLIQQTVKTKTGYALEPEISFVGEF